MVSTHPKATDGSPGLIVTWNGGRGKAAGGESVLTAPAKPRRLTAQSSPRSLRPSPNAHTRLLCVLGQGSRGRPPRPTPCLLSAPSHTDTRPRGVGCVGTHSSGGSTFTVNSGNTD